MKHVFKFTFLTILFSLFMTACDDTESFSELQDKEVELIDQYIKNSGINVVSEMPGEDAWGNSTYYKTPSGIYFHLVASGDTVNRIKTRSNVSYRYIVYNLKDKTTVSYWEPGILPIPFSVVYDATNATSIASGIFESLGYMKNKGAVAKVIVPSANNTSDYSINVIPVVYDLKITNIK